MAATTSEVGIANRALSRLGEGSISNIETPTTKVENLVANCFGDIRQSLLRGFVFNFSKKRTAINKITDSEPPFDYSTYYQLPADFLRLLSIEGDSPRWQDLYRETDGDRILYDSTADSINLRYVADVTDVTKWDALFKDCMVLKLAIELAPSVCSKSTSQIVQVLEEQFTDALRKAVAVDGQENPVDIIQRSPTIERRMGGGPEYDSRYIRFS